MNYYNSLTKERRWGLQGLLLLVLLLGSPSFAVAASGDQGSAAGITLKLDPGARSSALGSAYVAEYNDPMNIHFNPAGLGALTRTEGLFTRFQLLSGFDDISLNHLSFVTPIVKDHAGFGLSVTSLDYGSLERTKVNSQRNPVTGGLGQFGANDLSLSGSLGVSLTDSLKAGLTGTYFRSNIAGFNASTVAGDIGFQYHIVPHGLIVGLAARNLGGGIKFVRKEDPLPAVYDLGVSSRWTIRGGADMLKINGDFIFPEHSDPYLATGLEYGFYRTLFLRAGYNGAPEANNGFAFGFGIHDQRFEINYSYVPMGELGNNQRLTISYIFGGLPDEKEPEKEPTVRKKIRDRETDSLLEELRRRENYPYIRPGPGAPWLKAFEAGKRAYRDGNYVRAREFFLQAYRSNPGHVKNLLWLGTMEWYLGKTNKARKRMKQVLRLDPDNKIARKNLRRMRSSSK